MSDFPPWLHCQPMWPHRQEEDDEALARRLQQEEENMRDEELARRAAPSSLEDHRQAQIELWEQNFGPSAVARREQEKALQALRSEDADRELAERMQAEESRLFLEANSSSTGLIPESEGDPRLAMRRHQSTRHSRSDGGLPTFSDHSSHRHTGSLADDERLARLLEASGESLRNLSEQQVSEYMQTRGQPSVRPTGLSEQRQHALSRRTRSLSSGASCEGDPVSPQLSPVARPTPTPSVYAATPQDDQKHKKKSFLSFRKHSSKLKAKVSPSVDDIAALVPAAIPPPPGGSMGAGVVTGSACYSCGKSHGHFVMALNRRYHPECLRCVTCQGRIDSNHPFAYSTDSNGTKNPHHRKCYAESFGMMCVVCDEPLPASSDGIVSFVKHPFFESEVMCLSHLQENVRRCTGCQRFEPKARPFASLQDGDRCLCLSCCRTVVVDSDDVKPLWDTVLLFFEHYLGLPVWPSLRDIPILNVGSEILTEQMRYHNCIHGSSKHTTCRGMCLTDHSQASLNAPSLYFDSSSQSFSRVDRGSSVAFSGGAAVSAILCLSGLPRDLTASILAHQATHAWFKLHPKYQPHSIPVQVEEGVAQLIALLLLVDGLEPLPPSDDDVEKPTDEKLREYFRYAIESDKDELYGVGYQKATAAYSAVGMEALMNHIVVYHSLPAV